MTAETIPPARPRQGPFGGESDFVRSFIYYSTMLGVFSSALYILVGVHIAAFYGVMLINFALMFLFVNYARIPAWIPCLFLYLMINGWIGISNGTDTVTLFAKEIVGIMVYILYFYYFFRFIGNDVDRAFRTYCRLAFWFAIAGVPLWLLNCLRDGSLLRLKGLALEPSTLCLVIMPAFYWYVYQYSKTRRYLLEVIVFAFVVICSASSLGYMGLAFAGMMFVSGRGKNFLAIPLVLGVLLYGTYYFSSNFQSRFNNVIFATATSNLTESDLSTYALLSNAYVTQQVFHESPMMGNGLGSHSISHERFLGSIPGVRSFLNNRAEDINADDAASLTLRTLSELGLVGLCGFLIFLFYFHIGGSGPYAAISNGLLTFFFMKLLRNSLYLSPENFFFLFAYILAYRKFKLDSPAKVQQASPVPVTPLLQQN